MSCMKSCFTNWPSVELERQRLKGAARFPAVARSPGARKAPGGHARGPVDPPCGAVAAPCMGHSPVPTLCAFPRRFARSALKMALTQKLLDQQMTVLDQFQLEQIKTKDFAGILNRFELKKTLVVLGQADEVVERSARNIPNVKVLRYEGLNVYDLLNYHSVLLTQASVGKIEESLAS